MAEEISQTVARRQLRQTLRKTREQKGLTQLDVAEKMDWSLSKVIRIESGDVNISVNDLRALLTYLEVEDPSVVTGLLTVAKIARARPTQNRQSQTWYQDPHLRPHLTKPIIQLIEYEAVATWIHTYSVFHVPGPLQLPEYAYALTNMWSEELTPEQIEFRLVARRRRRETVLRRAGSLHYTALLDEAVFRRPIGGSAVLRAQLEEFLRLIDIGLLTLRVLPFDTDVAMSHNAGFDILFLGDDGDLSEAVLYRESGTMDEILEDREGPGNSGSPASKDVARHYDRYLKLWNAADTENDTIAFVRRRINDLG